MSGDCHAHLLDRLIHALIVLEANGDITIAASSSREDHDQRCWIAARLLVGMGLE